MDARQMLAFMAEADGIQGKEIFFLIASIVLLISAIVLIVVVLIQSNSAKGLSGAIAGGSDTFYGRTKGKSIEKKLAIVTIVIAIAFAIISLTIYALQSNLTYDEWIENIFGNINSSTNTNTSTDSFDDEKTEGETDGSTEGGSTEGGSTEGGSTEGGSTEGGTEGGTEGNE